MKGDILVLCRLKVDGVMQPGYMEPKEIARIMNEHKKKKGQRKNVS